MSKKLELRYYQQEAKANIYKYLNEQDGNPCVVLPTGSGKTPLLADICTDVAGKWGGRVIVLAHVKELIEQAAEKLSLFLPEKMIGINSASLKSRDTDKPVICASIQSVYKKAFDLGSFDIVIIDEAHLIPRNDGGMYRSFLSDMDSINPKHRVIGLTATPYRMDSGYIYGGDENILTDCCYEIGVKELIHKDYLSALRSKAGTTHADLSSVKIRGGEYRLDELEAAMGLIVRPACEEIINYTQDRKSVLVFSSGVSHGKHIQKTLNEMSGREVEFVCGDTNQDKRAEIIQKFKTGDLKYLVNVNVFTTGFDAPNVDCVVMLRATLSPGLYYQMVGRGLRKCEGKKDCLVLDYGENVLTHGTIDNIVVREKSKRGGEAPTKECEVCHEVVFAGVSTCPSCGFEFPKIAAKHSDSASGFGVLSGEVVDEDFTIYATTYHEHTSKKGKDKPKTFRVDYEYSFYGENKSQWLCFDHPVGSWPHNKACEWWRERSNNEPPESVAQAVLMANNGALANTLKITVRTTSGEKFPEIINFVLDEKPEAIKLEGMKSVMEKILLEDADEISLVDDFGDIPF